MLQVLCVCCISSASFTRVSYEVLYDDPMLSWSLAFFVLALLAAIFGFTGIAVASAGIAKLLFIVFLVLFVLSFFFRAAGKADRAVERNLE
jgi:uncharacterized membrane protein YtjA (UPF0391 family)